MILVFVLVAAGVFFLLGEFYGYLRGAIGIAMFAAILVVGVRWTRSAVTSQPEPEIADVSEYGLRYVCSVCALELKIEVAARDKPPTHCMEPMVLIRRGGQPPLRSVE